MNGVEVYHFICRCGSRPFDVTVPAPARTLHLTLGVLTLGVWLVLHALYRIGHLYWISLCPAYGRRSRRLVWTIVLTLLATAEFARLLVYFLVIAPERIIADASLAQVPEALDLESPIHSGNVGQAAGFLWWWPPPHGGHADRHLLPYLILGGSAPFRLQSCLPVT